MNKELEELKAYVEKELSVLAHRVKTLASHVLHPTIDTHVEETKKSIANAFANGVTGAQDVPAGDEPDAGSAPTSSTAVGAQATAESQPVPGILKTEGVAAGQAMNVEAGKNDAKPVDGQSAEGAAANRAKVDELKTAAEPGNVTNQNVKVEGDPATVAAAIKDANTAPNAGK